MTPDKNKQQKQDLKIRVILVCICSILLGLLYGRSQELPPESGSFLDLLVAILHDPLRFFVSLPRTANGWAYSLYGLGIGFIASLMQYSNYLQKRDLRPQSEQGSAKWNTDQKKYHKKYEATPRYSDLDKGIISTNMIMTNDQCLNMDDRATRRNNNVAILGASGTGKSRFYVKNNLLQVNCSYIVTDPAGELLESTRDFFIKAGYKIKVFNLVDMENSDTYNPFEYLKSDEEALTLVETLITNTNRGGKSPDPFWENAESALLQTFFLYLRHLGSVDEHDKPSLPNVKDLLATASPDPEKGRTELEQMITDFKADHDPDHVVVKSYDAYKSVDPEGKTAQSIVVTAQNALNSFILPAVVKLTASDSLELEKISEEKTILYVITPADKSTFNFLAGVLYTQLFQILYRTAEHNPGKRLKIPVRFILDEFANVGQIPEFEKKLATMRKYSISCNIILQNIGQLKAVYKDHWETILGNCDSKIFLGGSDDSTVDYICKSLGKETIRTQSVTTQKGKQGGYSIQYSKIGRDLMTASEIQTMDNDYCIYLLRGEAPFYARKFILESHPNYHLLASEEPKPENPKKEPNLIQDLLERLLAPILKILKRKGRDKND